MCARAHYGTEEGLLNYQNEMIRSRVVIIFFPWISHSPYKFLALLIETIAPIVEKVTLIGENFDRIKKASKDISFINIRIHMHLLRTVRPLFLSVLLWILKVITIQVLQSFYLVKLRKNIDIVLFYMAYPYYLLPLITSKLLRKRTMEVITRGKPGSAISKIMSLQNPILFNLLDGISPESSSIIRELKLEKYRHKLLPCGITPIDVTKYTIIKELSSREKVVAFIGRVIREKGIVEFIKSIPFIIKRDKTIKFLIGGDGILLDWVKKESKQLINSYGAKIRITGWIEGELPKYLNEIKLLVIPSYEEGLPSIIRESMACGTPVLTTPIGGVPDLIKDGQTGFLISYVEPRHLAKRIIEILADQDLLNRVSKNAHKLVVNTFNYRNVRKIWIRILKSLEL